MLHCQRCGNAIPEGTQQSWTLKVGTSLGSILGYGGGWFWGAGSQEHYARCFICLACAEALAAAKKRLQPWEVVLAVIFFFLGGILLGRLLFG